MLDSVFEASHFSFVLHMSGFDMFLEDTLHTLLRNAEFFDNRSLRITLLVQKCRVCQIVLSLASFVDSDKEMGADDVVVTLAVSKVFFLHLNDSTDQR